MRPLPPALGVVLVATMTSVGAAARPGSAGPVYELTPYAETAPTLTRAWRALHASGEGTEERRRQWLRSLREALDTPARARDGAWRDPHTRRTARWLGLRLARALDGGGVPVEAMARQLVDDEGRLADRARRVLADRAAAGGRPLEAARHLLAVTPGSPDDLRAYQRVAALARRAGTPAQGASALRSLLARPMAEGTRVELTGMAAELWREAGRPERAMRLLRRRWWHASHEEARRAALAALEGSKHAPDAGERLARRVLRSSAAEAEVLLEELRERTPDEPRRRRLHAWGEAVLTSGRADRGDDEDAGRRAVRITAQLAPAFAGTPDEPWFLLGRARTLRRVDRDLEAATVYGTIAREHPQHVLAVRALVEGGDLLKLRGMPAEADALFHRAVRLNRPGDAQREALWRIGLQAYLQGSWTEARRAWTRLVRRYGGDRDRAGVARAERGGYWLARLAEAEGRDREAVRRYTELLARFPLGWYAVLARQRRATLLQRTGTPPLVEASTRSGPRVASLGPAVTERRGTGLDELDVVRRPLLDRAVALVRLGAERRAIRELEAVRAADRLPGSGRALLATLHRRDGENELAVELLRRARLVLSRLTAPEGEGLAAAWPYDYDEPIHEQARRHRLPPALVAGVVHTESRYHPRIVSSAGAIGLMQLLPETARAVARKLTGDSVSRWALRDPETNIQLGAGLVRGLMDYFRGNPALALAAYHAGRGAVREWLRRRGHVTTDAFVETIPYDTTRRYVMQVVAVSEVYRRVHGVGGARVRVPMEPPVEPGPFLEASEDGD